MRNSQKKLPKKREADLKLEFATLLSDIKDPKVMMDFMNSFFKETEFLGLSKRMAIIKLLAKGHSYIYIQNHLNISSATISSIANFNNEKVLAKIIKKIEIDEWALKLARKIIKIIAFFK